MPRRAAHASANGENRIGNRNGNGKGGGKPPQSREVTVSRNLSYLLRHQAADEGIRLDEGGWACVADVVGFGFSYFGFFEGVALGEVLELELDSDLEKGGEEGRRGWGFSC